MKTLICDTNIFIDLIHAQALDTFWRLPHDVYTTDLVLAEMTVPAQKAQLIAAQAAGNLIVLELSGEEIGRVAGLAIQQGLSSMAPWVIHRIHLACLATQVELLYTVDGLARNPRLPKKLLQQLRDEISQASTLWRQDC